MKTVLLLSFIAFGCARQNSSDQESRPEMIQAPIKYSYPCKATNCKTVLSIADSISSGYLPHVARALDSKYNIMHPNENVRNSWYTLQHIDQWISEVEKPSLIIWNNGIWNTVNATLANAPGNFPEQYGTSLLDYELHLRQIGTKLNNTGAKVVFVTSTALDPSTIKYFDYNKIIDLNNVAKRVLPELGIEVVDLYEISLTIRYDQFDGIHFGFEGSKILAGEITRIIQDKMLL